jgi:general stress protein 26
MEENSSEIKNLSQQQAIEKLQQLIKHQPTCLFSTRLKSIPQITRPMSVQEVSDDGTFNFLSSTESNKNGDILIDPRVQLYFMNTSDYEFLTIYGTATITQDKRTIEKYWNNMAKAWFPEGKDDPRVSVIQFAPSEGFYWDTKDGKLVSLIKIAASAVMGKTLQEGVEGKIAL